MLIVYIGAISVLFLFVVMMLNIRILEIYSTFSVYLPLAIFLGLIFLVQIFLVYFNSFSLVEFNNLLIYINWTYFTNIKISLIGQLLFNYYYILFVGATLLLFIAMISVIVLTLDKTSAVHKLGHTVKLNNIN
jgi:NADH-quinone oxidoreductase subunit J